MGAVEETGKLIQDAQQLCEIEVRIEALEHARCPDTACFA